MQIKRLSSMTTLCLMKYLLMNSEINMQLLQTVQITPDHAPMNIKAEPNLYTAKAEQAMHLPHVLPLILPILNFMNIYRRFI